MVKKKREYCLQVRVSVTKEFLESVDKKVTKQRPPWRVNAANVDTSHDSALILNDHSLFSQGNQSSEGLYMSCASSMSI